MKYAILGGSFNPVHIGHLYLADAVLSGLGYDRIILIPAFQSPFKIGAEGASPSDRLEMLAASISGDPRLTIDDCEISREGVSYTIDTLNDIIARYRPEGKPGLVLGDDLASTFHKWHSPGEIAELADIIVARRLLDPEKAAVVKTSVSEEFTCPAHETSSAVSAEGEGREGSVIFPYPHKSLDNEIINVSSRQVREKISRAEAWRYLIPSGARYIIEDRRLYGFSKLSGGGISGGEQSDDREQAGDGLLETIVRLENHVRTILNRSRFIHSRNTALLSWDLCRRFNLDPGKGYLAGIAHDMCKSLDQEDLMRLAHRDGGSISKLELKKPGLLHARAAAVQLRRTYGITDNDIIDAIRYHTTGGRDMCPLAKVVYVADKIEVSRTGIEPFLIDMSRTADLDSLFAAVLDNTVAYLRSRQLDISYGTRKLLSAMNKRNKL